MTENFFPEETALKETSDLFFFVVVLRSPPLLWSWGPVSLGVLYWCGVAGEGRLVTKTSLFHMDLKSASKEDQFDWDELKVISKIK